MIGEVITGMKEEDSTTENMEVKGCRKQGGCNGQGVMVRRDMEVTEVVEKDAMDRVSW